MSQVVATAGGIVSAPAELVVRALADYETVRPRILPVQFSEYRVEAGGHGVGTTVHWKFAATSKRVRDQLLDVTEPAPGTLVETDRNSSMVTTWTVLAADTGVTTVRVRTTWNGAGGIGGFFERTFAPKGLARVYSDLIARLDAELAAG
ncbi:SRPBCC family protein [Blastococcus sp. TML/C7B]|uniref:SRPBCC family protein n=1 Tax=Blastococcus sp. TML/C7B TaxID=2798728 RepID=UPI00190D7970|nr:SRPBCC family protein [Blastococcus sp. TML/C7B]MBN1094931.1 SRPBCC family protein [Blastococcus sp. TML/C7B]